MSEPDPSRKSKPRHKVLRFFHLSCRSLSGACLRLLRILLKLLVLAYFLFCTLFLTLRYALLPNVASYKSDIELMASKAIGRKLSISNLTASWQGLNPRFILNNVVILDQQGRSALVLPSVNATLSWWSLAVADLRFRKIEIIQPSIDLRRDTAGQIFVAGFLVDSQKESDGTGLDWLLAQREIVIRQGALNWNDQARAAPELNLRDVNFLLNNQWGHHKFGLKARSGLSLAPALDLRGDFKHPAFTRKKTDVLAWSGELYADLQQADLSGLKTYLSMPVDLQTGRGELRSWARFETGRITDFTADLSLSDVFARLGKDLPALDMSQVSGRLVALEKSALGRKYLPALFGQAGHSISLVNFSMLTRAGLRFPATTISESFIPAQKDQAEKIELHATHLDLAALAQFAEHLPLPRDQRQLLADLAPRGQLKEFSARWQGAYPNISSYQLKGQFLNLALQPQAAQAARAKSATSPEKATMPAIPGFENISGRLDANEKGGDFMLNSSDVVLQLPGVFVNPLMLFDKLSMQAVWQFEGTDKFRFQVNKMDFQQAGMKAAFSAKHSMSTPKGQLEAKHEIDISGKFSGFDLKQLDRYIPIQTPDDLRHWLTTAILDGRADDVIVKIKGDAAAFPFNAVAGKAPAKTEFLVKGKLLDGKLNFAPAHLSDDGKAPLWPIIDKIDGSFVFDRARMEIRGDTAKTLTADLLKVKAVIPDLLSHNAILNIEGNVSSALQAMLQYVNASPVDGWLGHFLQESKASGNAQLKLGLQLPLNHLIESKVQGALQFSNNEALLQTSIPLISGVNGRLDFNEKGLTLNSLKGSLLGGSVIANGGTQKDGNIRIKLDGLATAEGLRKNFPEPFAERLLSRVSGAARYTAQVNVKKHQPELIIDSTLQGLSLNFPAPLRKNQGEQLPLHFSMSPLQGSNAAVLRDELRLNLGSAIAARYQRQKADERNATWQVLRGGVAVNAALPEPESGLSVNVDFKSLNVDEWRNVVSSNAGQANTNLSGAAEQDFSPYVVPNVLAVRTAELHIMGKTLDTVVLGASHQGGVWQANIDSSQISGFLSFIEASNAATGGALSARLSRLTIPASAASEVTELIEGKKSTAPLPSLDIFAENFELLNRKLGQLELVASNAPTPSGREWRIKKLALKNADAELKASGKWSNRSGDSISDLNYVLEIEDAGKLLDRFGFVSVMRGGRGKLEGDIRWNGLPYAMDVPSMNGQIRLDLASGQFLKVDPGAAKLLGVLSMQSLSRRFSLDFRDVFSEGFAFDGITGMAKINQGVARTDNLKMRSVNATVLIDGSADIAKETQDMHVAVIPEINAGAASVVYALAVNPVIGLGTFLAQLFLREPLARAFTYEYQITGPWKDPHVSKIGGRENQSPAIKP
ncbi:YhdP family protein [Undibacterium sp.]|uniref:YhdP family protein n=1 Tax=Undibacterium sp. TaxID=1914977 RepID=UPI0025EF283A|nr:YhdP family protein [Undibacterium sp.]